jgi:hypothetical protein
MEVGDAKSKQSDVQRERMIGLLSDPHGDLGVINGLIEPAELGEHNGGWTSETAD